MDENKPKKTLTPGAARLKIESWCAWQDRAQQEARDKLYDWGLHQADVENIISELIGNNFLNEERFALAYSQGKFRQKHWGKIKIKQGLKGKRVSEPLIKQALASLNYDDYLKVLKHVLEKKARTEKEKHRQKRQYKLQQYAYGRGFEPELIREVLASSNLLKF